MFLLELPSEILDLISNPLGPSDLWNLYDSCKTLRVVSARHLFRTVEIRFDGSYAEVLNSRPFSISCPRSSGRLLTTVAQWSPHVRNMDVWGDEEFLQPDFFDLLPRLGNLCSFSISYPPSLGSFQLLLERLAALPSLRSLSVDFMSPRIWTVPLTFNRLQHLQLSCIEHEPGLCVLPSLPMLETLTLNFCCYCLDCPKNGRGPCTLLQLLHLPRLRALSILGAQAGNVIWCGHAAQLQKLELAFCSGIDLIGLLGSAGNNLEELILSDCDFMAEGPTVSSVTLPVLQRVQINASISGLAQLCYAEIPSSAMIQMRIGPDDFEEVENWPLVRLRLALNPVSLSLTGSGALPYPLEPSSRLRQIASLSHIRLEGQKRL
ncbi:uncharacterized protein KD926_007469 [Aspergillus affinis]|uniref:uncharacterized protein n=1 Tax=Aspergillus affinis TaxID=1070780 RepID=UPI0022FE55B3|nr:uncharacterized protein KD926_007469 [Aspergillus affinis]KAI9041052.1 hypothetical protein KD926_007469 [Aspergillus affinis]